MIFSFKEDEDAVRRTDEIFRGYGRIAPWYWQPLLWAGRRACRAMLESSEQTGAGEGGGGVRLPCVLDELRDPIQTQKGAHSAW